jgi:hypothetical protein
MADRCEVWAPNQAQGPAQQLVAKALRLAPPWRCRARLGNRAVGPEAVPERHDICSLSMSVADIPDSFVPSPIGLRSDVIAKFSANAEG